MVVCCAIVSSSRAGSINYGDFATGTVIYKQVTESSTNPGVPLFGAPTPSGNALLFNPPNFSATASNGGLQFTDGTLNTNINAAPGQGINSIVVNEFGDYTLQPFSGTSSTFASVSAPVFLVIQAVNGVALTSPIHYNTSLTFTGGGTYSLPTNVGTGVIWSGSASIDVNAILAANNISGKATQIQYTMDNSLLAVSGGAGTLAFIKKKDIGGVTITTNVPEPSSIVLVGIMGTVGLIARWRRRR